MYDALMAGAQLRYTKFKSDATDCVPGRRSMCTSPRSLRSQRIIGGDSSRDKKANEHALKRCSSFGANDRRAHNALSNNKQASGTSVSGMRTSDSFQFYAIDSRVRNESQQPRLPLVSHDTTCCSDVSFKQSTLLDVDLSGNYTNRYRNHLDFERAEKKRRARLILDVGRIFASVQQVDSNNLRMENKMRGKMYGEGQTLKARETARIVFPKLSVALQKYLRFTRQQALHPPDAILFRLTQSLAYNMSAESFLSAYTAAHSVGIGALPSVVVIAPLLAVKRAACPVVRAQLLQTSANQQHPDNSAGSLNSVAHPQHHPIWKGCDGCRSPSNMTASYPHQFESWLLRSEVRPTCRGIKPGTRFELRRAGVTIICTVYKLPFFCLKERRKLPDGIPSLDRLVRIPNCSLSADELRKTEMRQLPLQVKSDLAIPDDNAMEVHL